MTVNAFLPRAQQILKAEGLVLPDYQVQYHLKKVEQFGDLRRYCRCLDELIFLNNSGLPIPAAPSPAAPALTVVKVKSK